MKHSSGLDWLCNNIFMWYTLSFCRLHDPSNMFPLIALLDLTWVASSNLHLEPRHKENKSNNLNDFSTHVVLKATCVFVSLKWRFELATYINTCSLKGYLLVVNILSCWLFLVWAICCFCFSFYVECLVSLICWTTSTSLD